MFKAEFIKKLGKFPADWELENLSAVIFFQEGPGITNDKFRNEGIPFINIRCFKNGRIDLDSCQYISEKLANGTYKHFQLSEFDWVFSSSGTIGKIALIHKEDLPLLLNTSTIRFRSKDETKLINNYIKAFLESDFFSKQHKLQTQGSAQVNLGPTHLELMQIPLPSPPEQSKIVEILSTVDRAIEQTEGLITKQQRIKTGLMQDLLSRGIDKHGNLRSEETHKFKNSPIGRIPVEWEVYRLENLTIKIGDGIHATPNYSENTDYFFINGNNLNHGLIDISGALCVDSKEYKKHYLELDERTILYSINGTIGNIALYKGEKIILGKSAAYIKVKSKVDVNYIYYGLQSQEIKNFYEYEMTGSTIKNLSLASIRNTPIKMPINKSEQKIISKMMSKMVDEIYQSKTCLLKLRALKIALMQDLLTGKIRVMPLLQ